MNYVLYTVWKLKFMCWEGLKPVCISGWLITSTKHSPHPWQGLALWRLLTLLSLGASCSVGTRSYRLQVIALQVHLIMCNCIPIRGPLNALWIYVWLMCNWKVHYNINWCGTLCILLKEVSPINSPLKLIVTHFQFKTVIKIYFNDIVNKVNMH